MLGKLTLYWNVHVVQHQLELSITECKVDTVKLCIVVEQLRSGCDGLEMETTIIVELQVDLAIEQAKNDEVTPNVYPRHQTFTNKHKQTIGSPRYNAKQKAFNS